MLEILNSHQYDCVLGSVYPYDAHIPLVWFSVFHILVNTKPGSVIILHDGKNRGKRTAKVLEQVLPKLKQRGIQVETLSRLIESIERIEN